MEFNNSDRPGGADGTMNIETGVFTAVTSGYYIITFSGYVDAHPDEYTNMWLFHNGKRVLESQFETYIGAGDSGSYIHNQGSRTVVRQAPMREKQMSYFFLPFFFLMGVSPSVDC